PYFWRNPPPHLLEAEVAPQSEFAIHLLLISPRLTLHSLEARSLGAGTWRVRLVVQNAGWLPTNVTERAAERNLVRPVEARISLRPEDESDGAEVVGSTLVELGQLTGRVLKNSMFQSSMMRGGDFTGDRAKADWIVRAPIGTVVSLETSHPRAGVLRHAVTLDERTAAR
ncbi:MAG: carboxypeptidase, partial [Acidobacteria bacterium]|nr:carboxypeptidase [Acidobacteriota bacterium]